MQKQVYFIQGGNDGYEPDAALVASLQRALGGDYAIIYPEIGTDTAAADFGWPKQIGDEIAQLNDDAMVVAHSLGASMLLKYLSENKIFKKLAAVFLLATPFWEGKEKWVQGMQLRHNFAEHLPKDIPMYFYHCYDDEEAPFDSLGRYRQLLPSATFRELEKGGHQFGNDLSIVAKDIIQL